MEGGAASDTLGQSSAHASVVSYGRVGPVYKKFIASVNGWGRMVGQVACIEGRTRAVPRKREDHSMLAPHYPPPHCQPTEDGPCSVLPTLRNFWTSVLLMMLSLHLEQREEAAQA